MRTFTLSEFRRMRPKDKDALVDARILGREPGRPYHRQLHHLHLIATHLWQSSIKDDSADSQIAAARYSTFSAWLLRGHERAAIEAVVRFNIDQLPLLFIEALLVAYGVIVPRVSEMEKEGV